MSYNYIYALIAYLKLVYILWWCIYTNYKYILCRQRWEFSITSIAMPLKNICVWSVSTAENAITVIFYLARFCLSLDPLKSISKVKNLNQPMCLKFQTLKYSKGRSELSASLLCFRNPGSNSPQMDNCITDISSYLRINIIFITEI